MPVILDSPLAPLPRPRPLDLGPLPTERNKRQLISSNIGSAKGRARILMAGAEGIRILNQGWNHDRTLAGLVLLVDAVLSRCDGTEEYDEVALQGVLGDARALCEGVEAYSDQVLFAQWVVNGCP